MRRWAWLIVVTTACLGCPGEVTNAPAPAPTSERALTTEATTAPTSESTKAPPKAKAPTEAPEGTDVVLEPEPTTVYVHLRVEDDLIKLDEPIAFEIDDPQIRPQSYEALDEVAQLLIENAEWHLRVEAHMGGPPREARARSLSGKRAASVREALIKRGVEAERIETVDYEWTRPIVKGPSMENRRIDLRIVGAER